MSKSLTKIQQNLVTENHNLIYEFAKKKHLPIEEYYDILAIGLCEASKIYDCNSGEFSTIAFRCMNSELNDYYKYINRGKRIPEDMILSYDAPSSGGDFDCKGNFLDSFTDNRCVHDIVASDIMSEILINLLSDKEQTIVKLLAKGMNQSDIAKRIGCKRQTVQYYITQIRKKWNTYLNR